MEELKDVLLRYEAPKDIFEKIYEDYNKKIKKNFLFEPNTLSIIYDELQQNNVYLTAVISQGKSGVIFQGQYKEEQVNIKCTKITDTERIEEQIKILQILKNTSYVCQPIKQFYSSDQSIYYQISKKYSCNLKTIMQNLFVQKEVLELNSIIGLAIQISTVLEIMQQSKFFHSDVNPENILYDSITKSFDLTNFGKSKQLNIQEESKIEDENNNDEKKYFSPEYYENEGNYDIKHDIYGLGIIILELSIGKFLNKLEYKQIINGKLEDYMSKNKCYQDINQIICQMLKIQTKDRIDSTQVIKLFEDFKFKQINEFILSVENKLDSFLSNTMISQFKKSFVQIDLDSCEQEQIKLDEYSFQGIDKISKIKEYLNKRIVHHLNLDFSNNRIDKQSSKDIVTCLAQCSDVTCLNLNLRGNQICAEEIQNIAIALEQCQKITNLNIDLRENQIGVDGVRHIGLSLEKCENIGNLSLDLSNNGIGFEGAKVIGMSLEQCRNITCLKLNLRENNVGVEGVKSIATSMQKCYQITSLNLSFNCNDMSEDGTIAIEEMRKKMKKLDEFNFYYY